MPVVVLLLIKMCRKFHQAESKEIRKEIKQKKKKKKKNNNNNNNNN
jgi:hypothetical protein